MPFAQSSGVRLYYEDSGAGPAVLFVHELASDLRQWRGTIAALRPRYRCIAWNARGYPPSDTPDAPEAYRWEAFAGDIGAVLDHLELPGAILVGWSMGGYAALQFARLRPERVLGLVLAGVGSGSPAAERGPFQAQMLELAQAWRTDPAAAAELVAASPGRQPLKRDPRAFAAWLADLKTHSPQGMALTCANYQALRPSLEACEADLARLSPPVLLMVGEADAPCLEASRWLARTIPGAQLTVLEGGGHAPMLEDPAGFARALEQFLAGLG